VETFGQQKKQNAAPKGDAVPAETPAVATFLCAAEAAVVETISGVLTSISATTIRWNG
jgi:hypothetical protein